MLTKMSYFKGYYFKHQNHNQTISFIVGKSSCCGEFIQVITAHKAYYFKGLGDCFFTDKGVIIDIGNIRGKIRYGKLTPLKYDIMGVFKFFEPLMECSHSIISMRHKLSGWVSIDGEIIDLNGGIGYIEGDCGCSFPKSYLWMQCNFKKNCSVSLSVADIPFMGFNFRGCICVVYYKGKEYRLATYCGVKVLLCNPRQVILQQGEYLLIADISADEGQRLAAPQNGKMSRAIRECIACPVRLRFYKAEKLVFDESSAMGSFEWVG
ncbi:MAG: hypothetical protein FWH07_01250 [Oscillospiraceae bacterium]|nr:hypothetical protein [Oscillospiraceae bacterium]